MEKETEQAVKQIHNYYINFDANQTDYENTVEYLKSIGFEKYYSFEDVLGDLYYSLMKKGTILIKVVEEYFPYDGVRIESETELSEEDLNGLVVVRHILCSEKKWPK